MSTHSLKYTTMACLSVLSMTGFSAAPAASQQVDRSLSGDATLVVTGRVDRVYRTASDSRDILVQVLVHQATAVRLDKLDRSTRYPAPGEYLYAHVDSAGSNRNRRASGSPVLPKPGMVVRLDLVVGDHQDWSFSSQNWTQEAGSSAEIDTPNRSVDRLGITSELVSVGLRSRGLKVTYVQPESPAAKAGIEVDDILVQANGVELTSPRQLKALVARSDRLLKLMVRDVRTGRDVPVEVGLRLERPNAAPARSLGVKTELAFYAGKAVLKVVTVVDGSPAQQAGIERGLLILAADGNRVSKPENLTTAARASQGLLVLQIVDPKTKNESTARVDLR